MDYENINDYEVLYLIGEDDNYREIIFEKYKPILIEICNNYMMSLERCGMEFDDLYQEALIALNRAIDTYDSESALFYTYACICVNRHLRTFCRCSNTKKKGVLNYAISTDLVINREDNLTIDDIICNKNDIYDGVDINLDLIDFKNDLSDIEAQIFELRYNGFTYPEIASLIGINLKRIYYYIQKIKDKIHCYF